MTFFSELTTQSNTAFNFGTRLMVFSGRSTRSTLKDLIVDKLLVISLPPSPLELIFQVLPTIDDQKRTFNNSRYVKANTDDCTADDHGVHDVPELA